MQLNNLKEIFTEIDRYFLVPLSTAISIVFFAIYLFNFKVFYISSNLAIYIGLISVFYAFTSCLIKLKKNKRVFKSTILVASNFSLTSLFLSLLFFIPTSSLFFSYRENVSLIGLGFILLSGILYFFSTRKYKPVISQDKFDDKPSLYIICLIFFSAILIRIINSAYYGVGYLDEYLHISKGLDIFNGSIRDFNEFGVYIRGDYVSYLFGLTNKIFDSNLMIADIVWTTLLTGLVFLLTYESAKKINLPNFLIYGLLVIYTIFPLAIFNHTYIRMFVVYELLLVLSILLSINLLREEKKSGLFFSAGALIVFFLFIFFKDLELLPILFLYTFTLAFFYYGKLNPFPKYLKQNYSYLLLLIISSITILIGLTLPLFVDFNIINGSGSLEKLFIYFFGYVGLITSVSLVSLFTNLKLKRYLSPSDKLLTFITMLLVTLITLHLLLPSELQVIRGLMYLSPLIVLGAASSLSQLQIGNHIKKIVVAVIISTSAFSSINMYINNVPEIEGEINYFDFSDAYADLSQCPGKKYALIHSNYISKVYEVDFDGIIYTNNENLVNDPGFKEVTVNHFEDIYTGTTVINDSDTFELLLNSDEFCILMMEERRHNRLYIDDNDYALIQKSTIQKSNKNHHGLLILTNR